MLPIVTITISGSSGLSKDEVSRMVADAESHASEDKTRRELIDARNQGDGLAYSVERTLMEHRSKLPAEDVSRVETGINQLREALKADDVAAIKQATDALQHASHAMAEQMYKQHPPGGGSGSSSQSGPEAKEGEVVDAEVVDA